MRRSAHDMSVLYDRWKDTAEVLWWRCGGARVPWAGSFDGALRQAYCPAGAEGDWATPEQVLDALRDVGRFDMDFFADLLRRTSYVGPTRGGDPPLFRTLLIKCVRIGYAVAAMDPSLVHPAERAVLLRWVAPEPPVDPSDDDHEPDDFLDDVRALLEAPVPVPVPETSDASPRGGVVDVVFPFSQLVPNARTSTVRVRARSSVEVETLDPLEAPVVLCLRVAKGTRVETQDGRLDVRRVDGTLYRPVLAPGTWRPIRMAEFASACASGEPWADNPFVPAVRDTPMSLAETAGAPGPMARADVSARDAAFVECMRRAGPLLSIEGVVYRAAPEPTIHVVAETGYRNGPTTMEQAALSRVTLALAWRMGGLASDAPQDGIPDTRRPAFDWFADAFPQRAGDSAKHAPEVLAFPLDLLDVATDFFGEVANRMGKFRLKRTVLARREIVGDRDVGEFLMDRLKASASSVFDGDLTVKAAAKAVDRSRRGEAWSEDLRRAIGKVPVPKSGPKRVRGAVTAAYAAVLAKAVNGDYAKVDDDEELLVTMSP